MSIRVIVTTPTGAKLPGKTNSVDARDGFMYVVLDTGSQGSFPIGRVQVVEDKDLPQGDIEHK